MNNTTTPIAEGQNSSAWDIVVAEAKQYAMMKLLGRYIEISSGRECVIQVNPKDKDDYIKLFSGNLLRFAENAFAEDAINAALPLRNS